MPSVSQKSSPADDYDSYQPCFFESEFEDDFYQDIPIPSDDIWKKFELLPTPPRSPRRDEDPLDDPTMEQLMRVSDILDCVELHECPSDIDNKTRTMLSPAAAVDNCEKCSQKMKSNLIQDCMWSTTWTCKLGMNTDTSKKAKSCDSQVKASVHSSNCQESTSKSRCSNSSSPTSFTSVDIPNVSTECVDPTAVFPFATTEDRCTHGLGTETPSDSEEEIDVVTVGEKKQQQLSRVASSPQLHQHLQRTSPRSIISRKNFTVLKAANSGSTPVVSSACSATVAAMHNYTQPKDAEPTKLSLVITRSTDNHHSYGVKRTLSSDGNGLRHIPSKKLRRTFSSRSTVSHGYHHSPPSSRSSSDSEDCVGKRSQHNDMERKRRIDLKYSFQKLRDQVPELHKMERAPKVTILKKAGDYIHQLRHNETALTSELKKQKERKEELSRKLATLRKCTWF